MLGSEEKWKGSPLLLERLWIEGSTWFIPLIKHWREDPSQTRIKVGKWARTPNHPVGCQQCPHHVMVSSPALPGCAEDTNHGRGCASLELNLLLWTQPWAPFQLWRQNRSSWQTPSPPSILWSCRNDRDPWVLSLFTHLCGSLPPGTAESPAHPFPLWDNCGETKDFTESKKQAKYNRIS